MIAIVSMLVIDFLVLTKWSKNYIVCITMLSCVYLAFLIIFKEMDITFSVYIVILFYLLARKKRISKQVFFYGVYSFIYVLIGLIFQERLNTVSVLLTRYGFLFLALFQLSKDLPEEANQTHNFISIIRLGTTAEIIMAVYITLNGDMENRLAINSQAIGGSLSIGLIVLSIAVYFVDKREWFKTHQMLLLIINLIIIVLSGTRGYMVMAFPPLIPFVYYYTFNKNQSKTGALLIMSLYLIVISIAIINYDIILTRLSAIFRLSEGIGYRTNENAYIKELFHVEPLYNKLFGFGIGGRANHIPANYSIACMAAGRRTWMVSKLLTETTCHNYWYMILFKQGVVGLAVCVSLFKCFFTEIRKIRIINKYLYYTLFLVLIGDIISLTFRISGTCGVFEILCVFWADKYAFASLQDKILL